MDEHPFRVLARKEFDGLSLDEKLAYLDLDLLAAIYARGARKNPQPGPANSSRKKPVERPRFGAR